MVVVDGVGWIPSTPAELEAIRSQNAREREILDRIIGFPAEQQDGETYYLSGEEQEEFMATVQQEFGRSPLYNHELEAIGALPPTSPA